MVDDPKKQRRTPAKGMPIPTTVRQAIEQGATMTNTGVVDDPNPGEPQTFGEDEGTDLNKPAHRRRATRGDISALETKLELRLVTETVAIRNEHSAAIAGVTTRFDNLNDKIDENKKANDEQNLGISNKVSEIAVKLAENNVHVSNLIANQKLENESKSRLATVGQELNMKDEHLDKDVKRELWKKLALGLIGLLLTVLGVLVERYIIHGPTKTEAPAQTPTELHK